MRHRLFSSQAGGAKASGLLEGFVSSLSFAADGADAAAFNPSDLGHRFLQAEADYVALLEAQVTDGSRAEGRIDTAFTTVTLVSQLIFDRPPTSVADLVDRALVARFWMMETNDGRWLNLSDGNQATRAQAECVLSILRLAGLSDGKTERVCRVTNGATGD